MCWRHLEGAIYTALPRSTHDGTKASRRPASAMEARGALEPNFRGLEARFVAVGFRMVDALLQLQHYMVQAVPFPSPGALRRSPLWNMAASQPGHVHVT